MAERMMGEGFEVLLVEHGIHGIHRGTRREINAGG